MSAHYSYLPVCLSLLLFSCTASKEKQEEKSTDIEEKARPFDFFAFQRSYPDAVFDWQGWHRTLQRLRADEKWQEESSAIRQKGAPSAQKTTLDACAGNTTAWTLQGPGNVGGRCNTLAVQPGNENVVLAGFAAGGIFKSADGAVTWKPVFDDYMELAIGDITFDPSNPQVVYAGTGDPNVPSIVFNGDGIYKSTDAGETWQWLGLKEVGIISKVLVHPTNPNVLWVAAMGNPYARTTDRGIYKSTDGGKTWQKTLYVSSVAGASDLVMSVQNPNILYAAFWERLRNNRESILFGYDAGIWKSTDGGDTWKKLSGGLPSGKWGRTGLAISQQNPDKLFAVYVDTLSKPGGIFRTGDGGQSWSPVTLSGLSTAYANFGWYFGKMTLNPANDEDLYFHAILLWQKASNNSAWLNPAGGHADSHDLVFTASGRRYWANDGGVYRNDPGRLGWTRSQNLPTTQIYRTNYNPLDPNRYYAGAQDNGIQRGNGAAYNAWVSMFPNDGFNSLFHPTDPKIYWMQTQDGTINSTTDGGQSWQVTPPCIGTGDHCNWDMPLFQSGFYRMRFYAGTHRVYVNTDQGGWSLISGDLTDGNLLGERFHNISALRESPLTEGQLYAGTSDGNVWRNTPGSPNWVNITAGLPDRYVTSVHGSPTQARRIFVTHSGFRDNVNLPHIHRSDNNGQTWSDISGDLPSLPVNDLWIMPNRADSVLIAATDGGVYFTTNGGKRWSRLGRGIPSIPVFDIEENPARKELLAATFARGLYTFPLDSVLKQRPALNIALSGTVGVPFTSVRVYPTGDTTAVVRIETDNAGLFFWNGLPGCRSYTVIPYRNDNPLNGVTTLDLALIAKHILNLVPLDSPYKMIAADANKSGTITTLDIVALRRLILGIDSVLARNTSWRFVRSSYVFPNASNPFSAPFPESDTLLTGSSPVNNVRFIPIKVGNVN